MMGRRAPETSSGSGLSPKVVDRILLGLCALIWLVLLGMSVAAVVALVDLGRGFHQPTEDPHTGLLYIVIGVSALIILGAIPVLLRTRQPGVSGRPAGLPPLSRDGRVSVRRAEGQLPDGEFDARAGGRRSVGPRRASPHLAEVERILLRGVTELACVTGAALTAVAVATYLMTVGKDTGAWVGYGAAGIITAAMPTVPWLHVRQLRDLIG
ncbi:MAG: DUF2561 family protein [Mycobacterium sp.]